MDVEISTASTKCESARKGKIFMCLKAVICYDNVKPLFQVHSQVRGWRAVSWCLVIFTIHNKCFTGSL